MEKILINAIKSGSQDVLLKIYKQYRNDFIRWAMNYYKVSIEEAREVFQEVMITFHDNINNGKVTELNCDLRTYLFQKAKYKLTRIFKKAQNKRALTYKPAIDFASFHTHAYVNKLEGPGKRIIQLFYVHELTEQEVAKAMGYKDATVAKYKRFECFKKLMELVNMKKQHERY